MLHISSNLPSRDIYGLTYAGAHVVFKLQAVREVGPLYDPSLDLNLGTRHHAPIKVRDLLFHFELESLELSLVLPVGYLQGSQQRDFEETDFLDEVVSDLPVLSMDVSAH